MQITIQHGCGHDRVIDTPGPEDPQGLLAPFARTRGAVHRAPASKCPACENFLPPRSEIDALEPAGLPSGADLDAVAAAQDLQTPAIAEEPSASDPDSGLAPLA